MAKDKGHRRPEAIPLPETVKDALSRPSKNAPYVSHSVKAEGGQESVEKSELTSNNHAFYVGKMMPYSFDEKIQKLLGWSGADGRIYTPEVIKGLLDYAFQNLKDGEKLRFVIAPSFSELFNGSDDVERALSPEKEIELIQKIAKKEFGLGAKPLEIVDMEQEPLNRDLFEQLRSSIDSETKVVDPKKAFETNERIELGENSSSLQIAQLLYRVSEEDERLAMAFEHAVPGRFKESENTQYYALTEVAVRLAEILKGRIIHGGAERQEVYDRIIAKIIKGKEGSYKNIKALEPLFKLFEGKRFETIHLKTRENYYELKRKRNLARCRMLLTAALMAGGTYGIYEKGKYDERQEQDKIDKIVDRDLYESLKSESFYLNGPFIELSKEQNVDIFHEIVDEALVDIGHRYYLSGYPEILEDLRPFLQGFFLENKSKLSIIHGGNNFVRMDLEDGFMLKYAIFLRNKGVEIERPYQKLMPYINDFNKVLGSDENFVYDDDSQDKPFRISKIFPIGNFYSGSDDVYEFYQYTDGNGERHIVAKEGVFKYSEYVGAGPAGFVDEEKEHIRYSSKKAREGIKQFFYAIQRFNAVPLMGIENVRNNMLLKNYDNGYRTVCTDMAEKADRAEKMAPWGVKHYKDEISGVEFEYYIWDDFDEKTLASEPCLMARKPGENNFTSKTGLDMAKYLREVIDENWYTYTFGQYIEDNLPFDFTAIRCEIESILNFAYGIENMFDGTEDSNQLKMQIEYIKNVSVATKEDIKQYDGSYKSAKGILDDMDSLRRLYDELITILDETTFIDECTQEPVALSEIIEDAEINARLNLIFQARNTLMEMKIPWSETEKKVS